jgi:hypothetical protein
MGHVHRLKIWPEHFAAVKSGAKRAEFRKDDRTPRFEVGDMLVLEEYDPDLGIYTCEKGDPEGTHYAKVSHVARGGVIPEGYAMLSLRHPFDNLEVADAPR